MFSSFYVLLMFGVSNLRCSNGIFDNTKSCMWSSIISKYLRYIHIYISTLHPMLWWCMAEKTVDMFIFVLVRIVDFPLRKTIHIMTRHDVPRMLLDLHQATTQIWRDHVFDPVDFHLPLDVHAMTYMTFQEKMYHNIYGCAPDTIYSWTSVLPSYFLGPPQFHRYNFAITYMLISSHLQCDARPQNTMMTYLILNLFNHVRDQLALEIEDFRCVLLMTYTRMIYWLAMILNVVVVVVIVVVASHSSLCYL